MQINELAAKLQDVRHYINVILHRPSSFEGAEYDSLRGNLEAYDLLEKHLSNFSDEGLTGGFKNGRIPHVDTIRDSARLISNTEIADEICCAIEQRYGIDAYHCKVLDETEILHREYRQALAANV